MTSWGKWSTKSIRRSSSLRTLIMATLTLKRICLKDASVICKNWGQTLKSIEMIRRKILNQSTNKSWTSLTSQTWPKSRSNSTRCSRRITFKWDNNSPPKKRLQENSTWWARRWESSLSRSRKWVQRRATACSRRRISDLSTAPHVRRIWPTWLECLWTTLTGRSFHSERVPMTG